MEFEVQLFCLFCKNEKMGTTYEQLNTHCKFSILQLSAVKICDI